MIRLYVGVHSNMREMYFSWQWGGITKNLKIFQKNFYSILGEFKRDPLNSQDLDSIYLNLQELNKIISQEQYSIEAIFSS